ncbi:hypothetical protein [Nocardioides sp. J54]|uniref:hypothetical protein n=1 Tax=Nocardioides sp. J54 TaxID=935866 RepID=UPI00048CAC1A|nr:hypothetical protein [Nocardioides sp. J54]
MNRTTVVAIAAAAVIGTTGGVTLAVAGVGSGDRDPGASDRTTPGGSSTDTTATDTTATDPATDASSSSDGGAPQPLYYADGAIHDGGTSVAVPTEVAANDVYELYAVSGGWLVVNGEDDSSSDIVYTGTYVQQDGAAWRIGEWRGAADITADRRRVVYSDRFKWHVATFADRTTEALDVLDGVGKELPFMEVDTLREGVAIGPEGIISAYDAGGTSRLAQTEKDHWTHEEWGPRGVDVPLTSPDATRAVASYPHPDLAPDSPFGSCLTGGATDDTGSWWEECEVGPASPEPWSPSGAGLLAMGTASDGWGPSWLRVVDPLTGEELSEVDPGNLLVRGQWGDETTVFALVLDDRDFSGRIKACDTGTGKCTEVKRVSDSAVLGSR